MVQNASLIWTNFHTGLAFFVGSAYNPIFDTFKIKKCSQSLL